MMALLRIGGLIGGLLLLIMAVGGSVVRQEASEAYWIVTSQLVGDYPNVRRSYELFAPDGSVSRQIVNGIGEHAEFEFWTPDGNWIAYTEWFLDGSIWLMRRHWMHGYVERWLEGELWHDVRSYGEYGQNYLMSPDQSWYAIRLRQVTGSFDLFMVRVDGNDAVPVMLTGTTGWFSWSSDSNWLYHVAQKPEDDYALYRRHVDSDTIEQVGSYPLRRDGLWSPNKGNFAYVLDGHVYCMNIETMEVQQLSVEEGQYEIRSWIGEDWLIVKHYDIGGARTSRLIRVGVDSGEWTPLMDGFALLQDVYSADSQSIYLLILEGSIRNIHRINPLTLENRVLVEAFEYDTIRWIDSRKWLVCLVCDQSDVIYYSIDSNTVERHLMASNTIPPNVEPQIWYFPPDEDTLLIEYFTIWPSPYNTIMVFNVRSGDKVMLKDHLFIDLSGFIDMEWSQLGMVGVGIGMLVMSIGMMAIRFRRMT